MALKIFVKPTAQFESCTCKARFHQPLSTLRIQVPKFWYSHTKGPFKDSILDLEPHDLGTVGSTGNQVNRNIENNLETRFYRDVEPIIGGFGTP